MFRLLLEEDRTHRSSGRLALSVLSKWYSRNLTVRDRVRCHHWGVLDAALNGGHLGIMTFAGQHIWLGASGDRSVRDYRTLAGFRERKGLR